MSWEFWRLTMQRRKGGRGEEEGERAERAESVTG
jgi:hypothetical protein